MKTNISLAYRPTLNKKQPLWVRFKKEAMFHFMIWLGVAFVVLFNYVPMSGIIIAFKKYTFRGGVWGSPWVGLANFRTLFSDFFMGNALINTLGIAVLSIALSYPATIIFTLFLNELTNVRFKRIIQTVSYLPHFISWAIMTVILNVMLSPSEGILNILMVNLGLTQQPIAFLAREDLYWIVVVVSSIWKNLGWSTIVYLAIIAGIDESLYEAARIDGAGRFARMRYITLPALTGIICINLILTVGSITGTGFETSFFLSNSLNYARSNTLSYYVYQIGLQRADFSYSTAIGLLLSCVSATLMLSANKITNLINGRGLF